MDKDIRVVITPSTLIAALAIFAGAYVVWLLRDLVLLILAAVVIASAVEPGIMFFRRAKLPRFFATLLMYVLVLGSVFCLVYFFFPPILGDAASFLSAAPQYLNTLNLPSISGLGSASNFLQTSHQAQSVLGTLIALQGAFSSAGSGVVELVSTFFGGVFSLLLVIVLSFYFALQETGVDDFLHLIVPAAHESYAIDLWRRSQKKIGRWMQGQILLSVIVGILVYLGLLILNVPYALLLAVFTAVAEIIPIFGSLAAGAFAAAVAFSAEGFAFAVIVVGLYIVVNQFESNLIYPLIVKKVVGIPPLLVIIALIAGGTLAGFLGVLLSVPISAVILELLSDVSARKHNRTVPVGVA